MGKWLAAIIAIIIIAVGGVLIARNNNSSNNSNNTSNNSQNMSSMNSTSSNSTNPPAAQSANTVTIQNFAFSPASITVKKGTKVTWTNKDSTTHTVTETDSQKGPDSGNLSPGNSYSFTFDTAGTYHYHCSIHTTMTGTVTVTE